MTKENANNIKLNLRSKYKAEFDTSVCMHIEDRGPKKTHGHVSSAKYLRMPEPWVTCVFYLYVLHVLWQAGVTLME